VGIEGKTRTDRRFVSTFAKAGASALLVFLAECADKVSTSQNG